MKKKYRKKYLSLWNYWRARFQFIIGLIIGNLIKLIEIKFRISAVFFSITKRNKLNLEKMLSFSICPESIKIWNHQKKWKMSSILIAHFNQEIYFVRSDVRLSLYPLMSCTCKMILTQKDAHNGFTSQYGQKEELKLGLK